MKPTIKDRFLNILVLAITGCWYAFVLAIVIIVCAAFWSVADGVPSL